AVLVYNNKIIGEGFHEHYGQAHAEVNAIESVPTIHQHLIPQSTLYVTLEPCSHYGKTPPCSDLIIEKNIPQLFIGSVDPNPRVAGTGIEKLKQAGIKVTTKILEKECLEINKAFFTFHQKKRPYFILKWAESQDGFIALPGPKQVKLSNAYVNRLVHRWRSETAGILIGYNTAKIDHPRLTNRLWSGASPIRIILDPKDELPATLHLFQDGNPTLIYNLKVNRKNDAAEWISVAPQKDFLQEVCHDLFERKILSVLVEGGAKTLQTLLQKKLWDEIRIIQGKHSLGEGLPAPKISCQTTTEESIEDNTIRYCFPTEQL
ncbi:MAG TPA: bifunctional diaminohydroxyphosphoribosylaminopyrimidine deaminase/5-amino-6-(5-phosphoribosylamino)uracil reductase RibD, partial [Chitinophagaceae bacterium]|nr:bifunctional diaminohydroxyphosphoribosylaminopyrimidine deaminase/5-amino-6-(5-phosphoribosylamino)uracil reductase RibD [Chitinophagaceae bacterium]